MPNDKPDDLKKQEPKIEASPTQSQTLRVQASSTEPIGEGTLIAGQYKVLSSLGAGGMSQVYRCQDLSLNRTVAIKLLQEKGHADSQALIRFQREGKAIALLQHENIVKVHSLQWQGNQMPFLVMEVVDGMSLSDLVAKNGPLPAKRVVKLLDQVCDALTHAHTHGVIHHAYHRKVQNT
jgi:eukaryotic-like serine/threonine-protein kinase